MITTKKINATLTYDYIDKFINSTCSNNDKKILYYHLIIAIQSYEVITMFI